MSDDPVTVGSLFAGIGGLDLAIEQVFPDARILWQVENDPKAVAVLEQHWPDAERFGDISFIVGSDVPGKLKKITEQQVLEAISMYGRGLSYAQIADYYRVSRQSMWDVLSRRGVQSRPQQRFGTENHFHRGGAEAEDRAHNLVEYAIRIGVLIRRDTCETCGSGGEFADGRSAVQAHHDDYNKPLKVRWLCQRCHHEWHRHNQATPLEDGRKLPPVKILAGGFP